MTKQYHFIQEVREQPAAVRATLEHVQGQAPELAAAYANRIQRVALVGCGDSYFLSVAASYAFEAWCGVDAEAIEAAEFTKYRAARVNPQTLVIGISSSGRSLAVLEALDRASAKDALSQKGAALLGLTNVEGSPLAIQATNAIVTQAGRSDAYPTKQTLAALAALYTLALEWGRLKATLAEEMYRALRAELLRVPETLQETLALEADLQELANGFAQESSFSFLGCGPNLGTAMHGAAKMIETSQSLGRAQNLEEFSHLHSYTVKPSEPVLILSRPGWIAEQAQALAPNLRENGGKILVIASEDERASWNDACDAFIAVPAHDEMLGPLVAAAPLQLFAYGVAMAKGTNPDKPDRRGSDYIQKIIYGGMLDGYAER